MSSDKQIEAAKKFVASLTGEYSMPADAYVALAELRQALAAHEAEKQAVEHRPGCDALGGYGHGVGACNCGADESEKQAGPVAGQVVYLHRLSKFESGKWIPATELIAGPPAPEWAELAASKPDLWRVDRRVTGVEIARGLVRAVQASATDTAPPSPLDEQDKASMEDIYQAWYACGLDVLGAEWNKFFVAIRAARAKKEQP